MADTPIAFQAPFYIQNTQFYLSDIESFCVEDKTLFLITKEGESHEFTFSGDEEKAQIIQMMTVFVQHL